MENSLDLKTMLKDNLQLRIKTSPYGDGMIYIELHYTPDKSIHKLDESTLITYDTITISDLDLS